jgi:UDP-glucose 4-epimerase
MNVLVTGAHGFLGRHMARKFSAAGHTVTGIGHGKWYAEEFNRWGITHWVETTITFEALLNIHGQFDVIVHCGGSGSVAYSKGNPYEDFQKSVQSTLSLLEYIRLQSPKAKFIYPSSPAAQGNMPDAPIHEETISLPISPYGFHKKIAEELCLSYSRNYDVNVGIVRFFSIYGAGLKKQLLYDACKKIATQKEGDFVFHGTGGETRDWLHVEDAASLVLRLSENLGKWAVVNGGTGIRTEISEVLQLVVSEFDTSRKIKFNNISRDGDPKYYWADITKMKDLGWKPTVPLADGIKSYVAFFKNISL